MPITVGWRWLGWNAPSLITRRSLVQSQVAPYLPLGTYANFSDHINRKNSIFSAFDLSFYGFKVSNRGYFVYCNGKKDESSSGRSLSFDVVLLPFDGDDSWVEPKIIEIKRVLDFDLIPDATPGCKFCQYHQTVSQLLSSKSQKINA
jgi:hypothetical protein